MMMVMIIDMMTIMMIGDNDDGQRKDRILPFYYSALSAISVYANRHPVTGTPAQWP